MKGKSQMIDSLYFSLFCSHWGTKQWSQNYLAKFLIFDMLLNIENFGPVFHDFIIQNPLIAKKTLQYKNTQRTLNFDKIKNIYKIINFQLFILKRILILGFDRERHHRFSELFFINV